MKNKKHSENEMKFKLAIVFVVVIIFVCSLFFQNQISKILQIAPVIYRENEVSTEQIESSNYKVHYIDVGQGNSSFVELPDGKTMLIDAGNTMYGQTVVDYISKYQVTKIDYLIATHSDSDHVGGMDKIFETFEIKNIYRPFQISGTGTSADNFEPYEYEDLAEVYLHYKTIYHNKLSRVESDIYKSFIKNTYTETFHDGEEIKNSSVTVFYDGLKIVGDGYEIEFFAPLVRDENLDLSTMSNTFGFATVGYGVSNNNDNSAIFLLSFDNESYFYTGDATWKKDSTDTSENHAEQDFVNSLTDAEKQSFKKITVYLAGHHGSKYSSSQELTEIISPKFVVISVGENTYGHPSQEAILRFENNFLNLEEDYLLRTDECGSIIFASVNTQPKYCLEKTDKATRLSISPVVLSAIICGVIIVLVLSVKTTGYNKKSTRKR